MNATEPHTPIHRVNRLIRAAYGEDWYGTYPTVVANVLIGYAEPGYGTDETIVVLGDWNDNVRHDTESRRMVPKSGNRLADMKPSRLGNALENIPGVEIEWLDEWAECSECYRAIRTEADSYSWQPSYLFTEDGYVCHDCAKKDINAYLQDYINDSDKAVTWLDSSELSTAGWTQWEESDPHTYESGWYPGQTDNPADILASIQQETDSDVVFLIDSVGQFDMRFSAYTRDQESN